MRKKTVILKGLSMTVFFATEGMVVSNICNRKSQSIKYSWKGKRFKLSLSRVDFRQLYWISFLKVRQIATDDLHFIICWWQWQWLCQVYSLAVMITRKPDFEPIPDPSPTQSQKHHSLLYAYGGSYKYTNIQHIIQSHCTSGIPGASAHWPLSIHPSRCSGIQTS